ncbi:hypothetical protein [Salinibacter ruber]|uniref:hypothetical protein n=1 Tax=Salinibacter ruber TaxID=146919 RepID=UPI0021690C65|nr:hypothetical protein [Salinibacter ruber]MCS3643227.1 hypothetical protein [Salinibacter ruber]
MDSNEQLARALDEINSRDPFSVLVEEGRSPEELKKSIKTALKPHFENPQIVEDWYPYLVSEYINLSFISSDADAQEAFEGVKLTYRNSRSADSERCFETCGRFEKDTISSLSQMWSHMYLEHDKADLPLTEFRQEAFKNIGDLIEGTLKPFLQELLLQNRFARGKVSTYDDVRDLRLGNITQELIDTTSFRGAFKPGSWNLRLNDWRNIAHHHTSRVEGKEIIGEYDVGSNTKEIRLSRQDLTDVLYKIALIFKAIRTARTLFVFDNRDEIRPHIVDEVEGRSDMNVLAIAMAISPEGFELADIKVGGSSAKAVIRERTDQPVQERMIHASQFVYPVWEHFRKEVIQIEYQDREGNLVLTSEVSGEACKSVAEGDVPFSDLAEEADLVYHEQ